MEKFKLHMKEWGFIYVYVILSISMTILFWSLVCYGSELVIKEVKKVGLKNIAHDIWEGEKIK